MGCLCQSVNGNNSPVNNSNQPAPKQETNYHGPKNENEKNSNESSNINNINYINQNNNYNNDNLISKNNPEIPLHVYDPKLLISTNSNISTVSSVQQELLIGGGKLNDQHNYQLGDFANKDLQNLVKNKGLNKGQKPINESCICNFSALSQEKINTNNYLNIKPFTQINPIRPKFQKIIPQNGKKKDNIINKKEKINESVHDVDKRNGNALNIRKKDNGPILEI